MNKNDKLKSQSSLARRKGTTAKLSKISVKIIRLSHVAAQLGHGVHCGDLDLRGLARSTFSAPSLDFSHALTAHLYMVPHCLQMLHG